MSRRVRIAILALALIQVAASQALAQTQDQRFRASIREMIEASGAAVRGAEFASLMAVPMFEMLKRARPDIPDRAFAIVREELAAEFARMDGPDGIQESIVDLYAQHFTPDEVSALLQFYRSPLGRKVATTMPILLQESAEIGQRWMRMHSPQIRAAIDARLRREGVLN